MSQEQKVQPEEPFFQEGDFVYCSWGYNQTNVNFAKIIEISDTRKTIVCRMVGKRTLGDGNRVDEKLMPRDEPYGDKFRLYVRGADKGDPYFVGSYPFINGNKADGTRKGTFLKWDKTSTRETRPGMGH